MSNLLNHFISDLLLSNDANSYDAFVELTDQIYTEASESPELWITQILSSLVEYPDSHILELIDVIVQEMDASQFQTCLRLAFQQSNELAKDILIVSVAEREDNTALEFLINLTTNSENQEISRIASILTLESSLRTGHLKDFLVKSYSFSNISSLLKQDICDCLASVYDHTQEMDSEHSSWFSEKRKHHIEHVLKSAQEEYHRKRYRSVINLLGQFDESELTKLGASILKVSKRKLAQENI